MPTAPAAYTFRPVTWADLPAVLHIQQASGIADYGASRLTEAALRTAWQPEKLTLAADAWLALAPDGAPVAYAEAPQTEQPVWVAFWVLPDYRGQGLEAQLLGLAEARTR